jgi:predicted lysophospholipase L1 biosynthesis ABC-type transport system permease subunit
MKALHKQVGDHVTLTGGMGARSLEITGQAVFPTLGAVHSDRVSLASGALVDRRVLDAATGGNGRGVGAIAVRFRPGADAAAAVQRMRTYGRRHPDLIIDAVFSGPKRPADIVNFREMGLAPTLMAALFGVAALGALANALVVSVHRRRRDLALLKALGVTRRQVSFAVAWQATITMVIALVIGVPIGVAIGRTLWIAFANSLGVVPRPTVPFMTLALVAAAVLIIANLIAALPGRAGSRTDAGVVLRTE